MNTLLNERGEEQLLTTNRFHWSISTAGRGPGAAVSCSASPPGQLRSLRQFESAFLEKPRARITAEGGQRGILIPKALHKPSTEKGTNSRVHGDTLLATLTSQQPCCQMRKRIGLSRSHCAASFSELTVEFAIFLNLMQARQEMKLKWLPNPFSVCKNPVGASSSFQIPFMGAKLPNVKTQEQKSRMSHKFRKPLSTTAKYLDSRKKRFPKASFPEYTCQMYMSRDPISEMVCIQFLSPHRLHISNSLCV